MDRDRRATAPRAMALSEALAGSVTLGGLLAQARISREWFDRARPVLGAALASQLRPGPVEERSWTLLADNGQAAAKARQLAPRLVDLVGATGGAIDAVRIKVSPRDSATG